MAASLILRRASAPSRSSGQWQHDDYDVIADGEVVGSIMYAGKGSPSGRQYKDRIPGHGYEATREAAMAACTHKCGHWLNIREDVK